MNFSNFTGSKSLPNKGTLDEFCSDIEKQGYRIYKKEQQQFILERGKNHRLKMLFKNKLGKELLLYISRQLDEQLLAGKIKKEDLGNCLVYTLERNGYTELVLGINSSFETVDTKNFTDEDWKKLFSVENYRKSRLKK